MCDDDILLLTDEDGEDIPFQIIDTLELHGDNYAIMMPLDDDEDESIFIFRITEDDEGPQYEQIEDEDLLQRVFDVYQSSSEDYEFCDAE